MDPMAEIKATFFQECEEQLAELEIGLLAMEAGDSGSETVNAVFRAVHSVKGGAGAFGLEDLVRFAHVFETAMDGVRTGRLASSPDIVKPMLRAADVLADLVRAARDGGGVDAARSEAIAAELSAMTDQDAHDSQDAQDGDGMGEIDFKPVQVMLTTDDPPAREASGWTVRFKPRSELYRKANESVLLLRELARLGEIDVELDASDLPLLPHLDPEGAYLAWTIRLRGEGSEAAVREVFEFVDTDCELDVQPSDPDSDAERDVEAVEDVEAGLDIDALIRNAQAQVRDGHAAVPETPMEATPLVPAAGASRPEPVKANASISAPTIRVDLERVDRLIDLVGELVINQAMLAQRVTEAGMARASSVAVGLDELEQLTREIQDSVMAIRAQPVKSVFQRMPRLAREVAGATGKQVRLVTEGEGTEVDKTVIERLADPLTHMIRNAIDHGLEKPDSRRDSGKNPEGVVRLSALHRSGRIVIEVSDDGAGINRERVRAIAAEKGLIAGDAMLSDEETDNLIFMPGFSTADSVSDISGRGVGMDVVRRSIQELGGRISIVSRPGLGSTFTMSLPLTLAVLDGMVLSVGDQTLVAPLTAIVETLQPRRSDVHSVSGGSRVIAIRDRYVALIDVGMALGYRSDPLDPEEGVALLIEGEGGSRAVLLVDAIQGQRQVVIKSLEANYRQVVGIAAATILGDGRVALILDADALVAASRGAEMRLLPTG